MWFELLQFGAGDRNRTDTGYSPTGFSRYSQLPEPSPQGNKFPEDVVVRTMSSPYHQC